MQSVPRESRTCITKGCDRVFECGKYSKRRYCDRCIEQKVLTNVNSLRTRRGGAYKKWLKNLNQVTRVIPARVKK